MQDKSAPAQTVAFTSVCKVELLAGVKLEAANADATQRRTRASTFGPRATKTHSGHNRLVSRHLSRHLSRLFCARKPVVSLAAQRAQPRVDVCLQRRAAACDAAAIVATERLEPRLRVRVERRLRLALRLAVRLLLGRPRGVRVGPPDRAAVNAVARHARDAACGDARHDLSTSLRERHAADGGGAEVGARLVDGAHRAEDLVSGLSPLRDERGVDDLLAHEELVQLARDSLLAVVQVVDESVLLIVDAVNGPGTLCLALAIVRVVDCDA
mmetsp:Transcript_19870/g.41898  ORF Transcript_19870/g.41898 Transcript_19870/m.41898 type:complete len:270 (+) Transcript_19870:949-1758(+)